MATPLRESRLVLFNRYNRDRAVMAGCNVITPTQPDDVFRVLRRDGLMNISGGAEFLQSLNGAVSFGRDRATFLTVRVIPVCSSLAYGWSGP